MNYKNNEPIAILLAVYNGGKFIREQIDSIINQTNNEWTLYIRDDKSIDNTLSIIEQYSSIHDNIILVEDNDGNLGCRGNFFRLLEVVESQYYMFSDADDVWFANKIQLSIDEMRALDKGELRPIIVHTDFTVTDANLNVLISEFWEHTNFVPEKYYSYNLIALANPVGGSMMIFNFYLKIYIFPLANNSLLHDRWIPMVAAKNNALFKAIHSPTKYYRMHENNFYGVKTSQSASIGNKIQEIIRLNYFVAKKLVDAGYGSYAKYLLYKLVYIYKRHF